MKMEKVNPKADDQVIEDIKFPKCGIIMPISAIDGCSPDHWAEVLAIYKEVISLAGFEPNLVSDADDSGVIQKRIIQNVYNNEIVICDVSGKNPNVMFELGMRLAFDKPTIVIIDDQTGFSFDTSPIEHLIYPRDLRYSKINSFKENLKIKIQATYRRATEDPNYTTFLKNFGEFKIAKISEKEVSSESFILSSLEDLKKEFNSLKLGISPFLNSHKSSIRLPFKTSQESEYFRNSLFRFLSDKGLQNSNDLKYNSELLGAFVYHLMNNINSPFHGREINELMDISFDFLQNNTLKINT